MAMDHIDEVVELGSTEIWKVTNNMAFPHNFHVHDVQFQVLSIAGAAPPPELAGWKDTVYLRPNSEYRLIMRFDDYSDPDHPYMYHCHLLRHEDSGMMGQFLVLRPGQSVPAVWTTGTMESDHHEH
jgi:bilirubin oxidase